MQYQDGYLAIDGSNYKRIWVVGDLHGCKTKFDQALAKVQFDAETDLIISVGDLIDRGPDSQGCLDLLQYPWFQAVLGNHEVMAISTLGADDERQANQYAAHWYVNGGEWFLGLSEPAMEAMWPSWERLSNLPYIIEVQLDGTKVVIAHANYPESYVFGKELDVEDVVWSRKRITDSQKGNVSDIEGADLFIFGHTPIKKVTQYANQVYIDTGAVFDGELTLYQIK